MEISMLIPYLCFLSAIHGSVLHQPVASLLLSPFLGPRWGSGLPCITTRILWVTSFSIFCFIKVSCQIFFTHSQEVRASPLFHHLHHLHHLPMKSHYVHLKKKGPKQRCRPGTVNFPRPKKLVKVSMTCEFYRKEKKSKFHWLRRKPTSSSESQPFVGSSWKQHHPAVYPLVN